jgi:acyl-CoA thioester hydrolase
MARLRVPVALRWSDMDAYAHVNNVEMLRLLEEARIEAFWAHPSPVTSVAVPATGRTPAPEADAASVPDARHPAPAEARTPWPTAVLDAGPGAQTSTLVARQEIEYLRPLGYRRTPVLVEMWIGHLGGASLDVCYEVHGGEEDGDAGPFARAVTTLVLVDAATGAPRRIAPAEQRGRRASPTQERRLTT